MMKKFAIHLFLTAILLVSPGCWSKNELTERGFVMGVALDQGKDGKIEMLTQIYRPTPAEGAKGTSAGPASTNILTRDDSINEAIRDIPVHLGRKAQWSHMRVIIVGEKLAQSVNIAKLLDLFYRDHEPRSTVSLMIAKGSASKMLEKKSLIEQTTAQQLLRAEESTYNNTSKTIDTSLLDLVKQLKSAHSDAVVSYVYEDKQTKDLFSAAGLALLKDGKMTGILPPSKVKGLIMLRNKFRSGIFEIPCEGRKNEMETIEILSLNTKVKPKLSGNRISVSVTVQGEASTGELKCSAIDKQPDEAAFVHKMEEEMKNQIRSTIRFLQVNKIDVIGVGNHIYRIHPQTWDGLKETWDKQFAKIPFDIRVELKLITNGTSTGKSVF
ncbi:Ger(x)C family spore germination protein [Paenibacillus prosopidis]|uniref:Spore germination protein KC n=1 Tax=Paenibacillus prosopidis TaxID=630520 RepID=A0A368W3B2_9BACL|nr:Ger(x)C family spore germination protein [Paenibacillus prosopidis]RCW48573.1 spore germination protein KC [Paenibacillus prosopidis]